jgi:defect-in-organelle-trafficking protein DotD
VRQIITLSVISLFLYGCSHQKPQQVSITDPASVQLAEAASSVSKSLVKLAKIEEAANPQVQLPSPQDPAEYDMGQLVSIDWHGPIEPLVDRLARASGYHVRILGNAPSVPILVKVNAKNLPVGEVIHNAHYQAHKRANVRIIPASRTVEIQYRLMS